MATAIIYGSTLGNTADIAKKIAKELKIDENNVINISEIKPEDLNKFDKLILGTSTWGVGDLQDNWLEFDFKKLDLKNKVVALFGLGDSQIYSFTYCNGLGKLYNQIKNKNAQIVGQVDAKKYTFSQSEAVVNGKFVGLALDNDNFPEESIKRIKEWVKDIKKYF